MSNMLLKAAMILWVLVALPLFTGCTGAEDLEHNGEPADLSAFPLSTWTQEVQWVSAEFMAACRESRNCRDSESWNRNLPREVEFYVVDPCRIGYQLIADQADKGKTYADDVDWTCKDPSWESRQVEPDPDPEDPVDPDPVEEDPVAERCGAGLVEAITMENSWVCPAMFFERSFDVGFADENCTLQFLEGEFEVQREGYTFHEMSQEANHIRWVWITDFDIPFGCYPANQDERPDGPM